MSKYCLDNMLFKKQSRVNQKVWGAIADVLPYGKYSKYTSAFKYKTIKQYFDKLEVRAIERSINETFGVDITIKKTTCIDDIIKLVANKIQ